MDDPAGDLIVQYRSILLRMHAVRVAGGKWAESWNKLVHEVQSLQLELRKTAEGRAGITRLIKDENITVRRWSAAYALMWDPAVAEAVLKHMETSGGVGSLEAKYTLREYRRGQLKMDWIPEGT